MLFCRLTSTEVESNFMDTICINDDEIIPGCSVGIDTRLSKAMPKLYTESEGLQCRAFKINTVPTLTVISVGMSFDIGQDALQSYEVDSARGMKPYTVICTSSA
jgi:hypothetical protein